MKIEQGRFYKTRNGRKVYVAGVLLPNVDGKQLVTYPVVGYLENEILYWTLEGRYRDSTGDYSLDLVAEWREPVTKVVTVYMHPNGNLYMSPWICPAAIASTRVLLTEGVFAEDKP